MCIGDPITDNRCAISYAHGRAEVAWHPQVILAVLSSTKSSVFTNGLNMNIVDEHAEDGGYSIGSTRQHGIDTDQDHADNSVLTRGP